jgi:hypothetical protein
MSTGSDPGTQPAEPGGSPGPHNRRRWWLAGGIVVAAAVVAAAVLGGIAIGRSADSGPVRLVAAGDPGPNPFTESTQRDAAPAPSDTVAKKTAQLRATLPKAAGTDTPVAGGTTPGLYGGSGDAQVCDPQRLVTFLAGANAKAAAWARVLGIAPAKIAAYVSGLTPVILGSDTLVQNHGYRSGAATSFPAILQAGTAVLVDATGTPRVKCNCGNPLTEPQPLSVVSAATIGTAWPGYAGGSVILIHSGRPGGSLPLVDLETGRVYDQPVGSAGAVWAAVTWSSSAGIGLVDQSVVWTSRDGASWARVATVPHELIDDLAWGDGRWVAVAVSDDQASVHSEILTSADLTSWSTAATVAERLRGVGFGGGRWLAVGDPADGYSDTLGLSAPSGRAVVHASDDGASWTPAATVQTPGADGFWSVAYGGGHWLATTAAVYVQDSPVSVFQSADGSAWAASGAPLSGQTTGSIAYGAGGWRIAAATTYPADQATGLPATEDTVIDAGTDAQTWATSTPAALKGRLPHGLAFGGGRWLLGSEDSGMQNQAHSLNTTTVSASADGTTWTTAGRIDGPLGALAYGSAVVGSATPSPAPSTPTPTPGGSGGSAGADCSAAALQHALDAAGLTGTIGTDLACSAGWATAGVNHPESQTTAVFQWVDGAWQVRDRTEVCAQNVLPPAVQPAACNSN